MQKMSFRFTYLKKSIKICKVEKEKVMKNNSLKTQNNIQAFRRGLKDGVPIALGYLAVSFSLGIAAKIAGLTPTEGLVASFLNHASAGEYAGFTMIAASATFVEIALATLVANLRYMLMSCSMSQRIDPKMPFFHRIFLGFFLTDELFGIAIARPGYLNPYYTYGAVAIASPCWAVGTMLGVIAGNLLPVSLMSAFSVALYGMFIAIIIPPAKQNKKVLMLIIIGFAASFAASVLPMIKELAEGTRTIIITVAISALAAIFFPIKKEEEEEK